MLKILPISEMKKNNINLDLALEKNLIVNDDYSLYLNVQALYRKALDYFFGQNVSLDKYNDMIKNSDLSFGVMPDEMKNLYHKSSYLNLEYIYVRNFLYVEKLNDAYLDIFKERISNSNYEVDEDLLLIVKETFRDVINNNYRDGQYVRKATTCYGSMVPQNIVPSDYLVIVIQYGKNPIKLNFQKFIDNSKDKKIFLSEISSYIKIEVETKLSINSKILIRDFVGE